MLDAEVSRIAFVALLLVCAMVMGLWLARRRHEARANATWVALAAEGDGARFEPSMLEGVPGPGRRYLTRAIPEGSPLAASVEFAMRGQIRTRPEANPLPLTAVQRLSADGLVWRARAGRGPLVIVGFDRYFEGVGEMRWWLAGLVPVATASGRDVTRSAAGRAVGESVLLPPLLLPRAGARWEPIDGARARVTRTIDGEEVTLTVTVDDEGRLLQVSLMRWRDDAGAGEPGPVRFDVHFRGEVENARYRVPATLRAGWRLGSPDAFQFFEATLDRVAYR